MKPVFTALSAILAMMAVNTGVIQSQSTDARLAAEKKCLTKLPYEQCNLVVTYGSPVGTLQCDEKVPESNSQALSLPPVLNVSSASGEISDELLLMFDPDAPVSSNASEGFIHLIAEVSVDTTGKVIIGTQYIDYIPPAPPRGLGEHRYQFLLYKQVPGKALNYNTSREFNLCSFVQANNLGQPTAAFQFKFERR